MLIHFFAHLFTTFITEDCMSQYELNVESSAAGVLPVDHKRCGLETDLLQGAMTDNKLHDGEIC